MRLDVWTAGRKEDWLRTGQVCAVLANIHRDPEKRPQPYASLDFTPWAQEKSIDSGRMTPDQFIAVAKAWKAALRGA